MRILKRIIFALLALVSLAGCMKNEPEIEQSADKIQFRTSTFDTKASSFVPDGKGDNIIKSMGVYAASTGTQEFDPSKHPMNFFDNLKVSRTDAASEWSYSGTQYWPVGNTSFFAYAPYAGKGIEITAPTVGVPLVKFTVANNQSEQVDLLLAKPALDRTKTSNAVTMQMQHALTKIGFSAKLSHSPTEIPDFEWAKVEKIELEGIYRKGTHTMDADGKWSDYDELAVIDNDGQGGIVINNNGNPGGLGDFELTTEYQNITKSDGYLLMLPQSLAGARGDGTVFAKLKVYVVTGIGNDTHPNYLTGQAIEFMLEETVLDWNQGEAINYMINIDLSDLTTQKSTLTAQVLDWTEISANTEILQRELNITRLEANVDGGAITRVHFWSNQPYVWIDKPGYKADQNSETSHVKNGDVDDMNSIFKDLAFDASGITTEDVMNTKYALYNNVTNFHYNPYDPKNPTSTGQGWFDVENVEKTATPDAINDVVNSFLVILCASNAKYIDKPLMRSVKLKSIIRAYPNSAITTPYVGTFHRWNEVGERIITWYNSGKWVAVLEPTPSEDQDGIPSDDYLNVLFDRFASPDPNIYESEVDYVVETKTLYKTKGLSPDNAENYKVSWGEGPYSGGKIAKGEPRWVWGDENIYLRIGWDSYASPTKNRYARMIIYSYSRDEDVTKDNINLGNLNYITTLYLRQGEGDDYLMRTRDVMPLGNVSIYGIDNSVGKSIRTKSISDPRPNVYKWNPYEVTDANINGGAGAHLGTEGNINYLNIQPSGHQGGGFVEFPTVVGVSWKWGYSRGICPYTANINLPDTYPYTEDPYYPGRYYNAWNEWAGTYISPYQKLINKWSDDDVEDVCPQGYVTPKHYNDAFEIPSNWMSNSTYNDLTKLNIVQSLMASPNVHGNEYGITGVFGLSNRSSNALYGYLADGYFDRRPIRKSENLGSTFGFVKGVMKNGRHVDSFDGGLLFNHKSLSSLFFVSGGYRMTYGLVGEGLYSVFATSTSTDHKVGTNYPSIITLQFIPFSHTGDHIATFTTQTYTDRLLEGWGSKTGAAYTGRCVVADKIPVTFVKTNPEYKSITQEINDAKFSVYEGSYVKLYGGFNEYEDNSGGLYGFVGWTDSSNPNDWIITYGGKTKYMPDEKSHAPNCIFNSYRIKAYRDKNNKFYAVWSKAPF